MAVCAAVWVMFNTLGTATGWGPWEMTSATALPGGRNVPTAGVWLTTCPVGTVALYACVTSPTVNPAPVIVVCAAAWVMFSTLGTVTGAGPWEMMSATALPGGSRVPAAGFWLMTLFTGTVPLYACVTAPTARPVSVMAD